MFKKGPTEKEKVFQKLTEKEIKDQLYGFNRLPREIIKEQEPVKPVKKEETIREPKNPYMGVQIILLAVFLILIWVSVRQIIRAISRPRPPQATQQKTKQKPLQQKNVNLRRK